jgi:hypothetical protein
VHEAPETEQLATDDRQWLVRDLVSSRYEMRIVSTRTDNRFARSRVVENPLSTCVEIKILILVQVDFKLCIRWNSVLYSQKAIEGEQKYIVTHR